MQDYRITYNQAHQILKLFNSRDKDYMGKLVESMTSAEYAASLSLKDLRQEAYNIKALALKVVQNRGVSLDGIAETVELPEPRPKPKEKQHNFDFS